MFASVSLVVMRISSMYLDMGALILLSNDELDRLPTVDFIACRLIFG
jgi:hypothetical protein